MRSPYQKILIFTGVLMVAGLACNTITGGGGAPSPTPEEAVSTFDDLTPTAMPETSPTSEPATDAPAPTAPSAGGEGAEGPGTFTLNADNLYGEPLIYNTYRTTVAFTFRGTAEDGSLVEGALNGEGARSVEPPATTVAFTSSGSAELGDEASYVFTQIGETDYIVAPSLGCATLATGGVGSVDLYALLLADGGMLGQLVGAERVLPNQNINGVNAYHYTFDETALDQTDPAVEEVTNIDGHLYVAPEGHVVRLVIDGVGMSAVLTGGLDLTGDIHYELNYFDFDAPVDISPPPECEELTSEFPMLEDAFNISSFTGLLTYSTNAEFDAVVDFYKGEMAADGWSLAQEFIFAPAATLSFNRDGSTALVTIGEDPTSGSVLVAIVEDSS